MIKKVVHECVICRRLEAVAYCAPPAPPLPDFRITEAPAFTFVGVDFAGPLYIKGLEGSAMTRSNKVWICLYTCCVTRGVHLDLVTDLSTLSFLKCFKRFVARRGIPVKVVSDNGKTFKAAAKILSEEMVSEVQTRLAPMQVKWLFNVERAPWWEGVFERMVKSMKRCLRKVVGRASLSYEELLTVVIEVEMIINCRPISYISQDDTEEPLTPSHLITGRRLLSLTDGIEAENAEDPEFETSQCALSKRMKALDQLMEHFWRRWKTEYLLELRTYHGRKARQRGHQLVAEGDVIIVQDERERCRFWKMALVMETLKSWK